MNQDADSRRQNSARHAQHPYPNHVNPNLGRLLSQLKMDKIFVRGEGCYLYDDEGRRYIDFLAQYGALPFGFNHPYIWRAVEQVRENLEPSFIQPSYLEAAGQLAERLIKAAPPGLRYVTFANSGAEAVEAAIKLCKSATGRPGILAANNSFHGKTLAALSATDKRKYQQGFGAPVPGYTYVPFGDLEALERALAGGEYAAFIVEPIQGEGGIIEAPPGYLAAAREICRDTGTLLIVDEIQTGLGRTGTMFACESEGITPDVMTVAKALGGGLVPIGACLCTEEVYNEDFALKHTSTFAGNTLACRVGLATLELLEKDDRLLIRQVAENGARLKQELLNLKRKYPEIIETVRGRGYMLGIHFGVNRYTWDSGLLGCLGQTEILTSLVVSHMLNVSGVRLGYTLNQGGVLRVEPPIIATWKECEVFLDAFEKTIRALDGRDTARFTAHITGLKADGTNPGPRPRRTAPRFSPSEGEAHFAFLLHPLTPRNYADIDDSLDPLSDEQITQLAAPIAENFDPFVIGEARIISDTGATAYGDFILLPRTARELLEMPYRDGLSEIRAAAEIASKRGAKIIGLGAYISVVTQGGLYLKGDGLPALTTGNSYTAVAGKQAIEAARSMQRQPLSGSTVAVVGASGSIGRAMAILLSEQAGRLILLGNSNHAARSRQRLLEVAGDVLKRLWGRRLAGENFAEDSLATRVFSRWRPHRPNMTRSDWTRMARELESCSGLIDLSCDVEQGLADADVVVTATSTASEIVASEQLLKRGALVCDISRPANVSRRLRETRPDLLIIDGGIVRLPEESMLNFNIDLEPGYVYACMAETMILALEGRHQDTGLGIDLDIDYALEIARLAERHGFKVAASHRSFERRAQPRLQVESV